MVCKGCDWDYPEEMLSRIFSNEGHTDPLCGICALAYINRVHGTRRKSFHGEQAESHRREALAWRTKHPENRKRVVP